MASMPSFSQKQEEFKEEFLTCPICTEPYDDSEHVAKCLPCLHSFCLSCLHLYVGKKKTFTCPKCRKSVQLDVEGELTSIPNNFIVDNLKEYHDIFNLTVPCGNCDDKKDAICFCHDCVCFVCQTCVDMHQKMRTLRLHDLSTMTELRDKKCNPMSIRQQRCEKHPKQDMNLYCQDQTCRVPVCPTCAHVEHRGHDMMYIEAAVERITAKLQEASKTVRAQLKELAQVKGTIKRAQACLSMSYRQKQTEMLGTLKELHDMIDQHYNDANSNMGDLYQQEMKQLDEQEKSVDTLSFQMSSACEYTESSCSINHHVQLLDSSKQIMERLLELKDAQFPKEDANSKEFIVSEKHAAAMDQFMKSLENLCDMKLIPSIGAYLAPPKSRPIPLGFPGFPSPTEYPPPPPKINFASYEEVANQKSKETPGKPVDPAQCTITLDSNPWRGKHCNAMVISKSADNLPIHTGGGAKIRASLKWRQSQMKGLPCSVIDHDNGTYTITYTPLLYGTSELSVTINGEIMDGSPFLVRAGEAKCD